MKKIKLFEEFISEVSIHTISGNSGRTIAALDNRKYELKKDVKDARISDYTNVTLPKGTIITNLPGGVFANHKDLKDKYCTGYKSERWDDTFGVMIRTMPDTLEAIEDNSKVLESMVSEVVELVHVYDTKGELQGTGELIKTKGNKSLIRWDGSNEEWIDSKLVKLVESNINEDAATTFLILMQSAMVMGQLAILGNKISSDSGSTPIDDLKRWWQKRKSDKAVKSIIDKIKDDKDVVEFMKLKPSQQRGKFRSLIATKLNDEELEYLNKINRNHFQTESLDNEHSLQESKQLNEAKILSREEMKNVMVTKYGLNFVKNSEEFDGEKDGIWLGGSDSLMPNAKSEEMFNYYHGGSKYPQGIHKDLAKFLDKCGWYGQFADPGTVFLWPR